MANYYNDNDKFAAQWLRNLIKARLIPNGDVDDRSILQVQPDDIQGYHQCHFFAGIAGWPRALELAGWNPTRPVWTASLPCQSLSCAGKGLGEKDERHLWPVFFSLVKKCRPPVIFGEQVASKDGREWLSGIFTDLETLEYITAAADLPAASCGSPHKRNRLFWVANAETAEWGSLPTEHIGRRFAQVGGSGGIINNGLADTKRHGRRPNKQRRQAKKREANFWHDSQFIQCADGKARRVPLKPTLFPLAARFPGRVGLLRGAGNSIVPQVAAEFIQAFLETE